MNVSKIVSVSNQSKTLFNSVRTKLAPYILAGSMLLVPSALKAQDSVEISKPWIATPNVSTDLDDDFDVSTTKTLAWTLIGLTSLFGLAAYFNSNNDNKDQL